MQRACLGAGNPARCLELFAMAQELDQADAGIAELALRALEQEKGDWVAQNQVVQDIVQHTCAALLRRASGEPDTATSPGPPAPRFRQLEGFLTLSLHMTVRLGSAAFVVQETFQSLLALAEAAAKEPDADATLLAAALVEGLMPLRTARPKDWRATMAACLARLEETSLHPKFGRRSLAYWHLFVDACVAVRTRHARGCAGGVKLLAVLTARAARGLPAASMFFC
jgi:hypothetical protein